MYKYETDDRADAVATAALSIADRYGLAKLTIRRVAEEVGIAPMTIYGTVASKEELVALVARRAFDEFELPELTQTWQENLVAIMRAYRALMLEHPSLAQIYATQRVSLDVLEHARLTDAALHELHKGRIKEDETASGYLSLLTFTLGHVLFELPRRGSEHATKGSAGIANLDDVRQFATEHSLDFLHRHVGEFFTAQSAMRSNSYEAGLRALIDGLGRLA